MQQRKAHLLIKRFETYQRNMDITWASSLELLIKVRSCLKKTLPIGKANLKIEKVSLYLSLNKKYILKKTRNCFPFFCNLLTFLFYYVLSMHVWYFPMWEKIQLILSSCYNKILCMWRPFSAWIKNMLSFLILEFQDF